MKKAWNQGAAPKEWVVWSFEHDAWWGPNERGYVKDLEAAGRYSRYDAGLIATADIRGGDVAIYLPTALIEGPPTIKSFWQ